MKKKILIKKYIYFMAIVSSFFYLIFRIFYTIPNSNSLDTIIGTIILLVEIVDFLFFIVYSVNILMTHYAIPNTPKILKKDYPELDVFIATINEDIDLIEGTIKSCKEMRYPNKKKIHIYLCDDGRRKEMKELCRKMKISYLDRKDNKNAKAGNYNNALKKTKSPYIVVFDADMRPTEDFLMKTIPYLFLEDKIGFIQLPQNFSNPDIFQRNFKLNNYIPLEQNYFYHRIQISRNSNNSAIFCGTNAIISREALEDIGGFATETITEDFATGLLIEGHGFKGIALPYDEVYGKNVENITSLIKQRARWCRGCIQTYNNYKIVTNKGLNIKQKVDYLSGIYYWFFGVRNIIYLLVPLLYSFFNIKVIQGNLLLFIILFLIQYILKRFIIDQLEDRKVSSTWNRIYEVILSPIIFIESLLEIIGIRKKKFEVTLKKNNNNKSIKYYYLVLSHLFLFILNITGLYISIKKSFAFNYIEFLIPIFWLSTNCIYLMFAIIFDFSNSESTKDIKNNRNSYSLSSTFVLFYKFIKEEIKVKRLAIISLIIIIFSFGLMINNYYQYRKSIVIDSESLVSYNGELSIDKGIIVNEKKEIVKLKGISSHNLHWYKGIYTKENLKEIRDTWGINTFRIALYTNPEEDGYIINKEQLKDVERIIDYCIDLDIYVIVDWHILKDNNPNIYKEEAIDFFKKKKKKYKDSPNIIYEICNEPNGEDVTWDEEIKPYAEDVIQVIRHNSKNSLIIVGLANWCKDISSAKNNLLEDKNIIYSVHFYAGAQNNQLKEEISSALKENMPLIVTECGATNESGDGKLYKNEFIKWIDFLDNNNISWIVWQLSEKDEASSLVIKKEVQDRLDYLYEKYTEQELKKKKYHINDYLSDTGKFMKEIFIKH